MLTLHDREGTTMVEDQDFYDEYEEEEDEVRIREKRKRRSAKRRKSAFMKVLPVFVAIILIIVVVGAFYGQKLMEKYSYGTDRADLNEYFKTENGKVSVVLDYERLEEKAIEYSGRLYVSEDFVKEHFTDHFYVSRNESSVLYTTATETIKCMIGEDFPYYLTKEDKVDLGYLPVLLKNDTVYFALDYLSLFVFMDYHRYNNPDYVNIFFKTPGYNCAVVNKDSAVRYQGGIKSPILADVQEGEKIGVIEEMEDWAKVVTFDGITGYIQIKQFDYVEETFNTRIDEDPQIALHYTDLTYPGKINMAFHQVFADPASHFTEDMANVHSVNIVAPTLYRITDEENMVNALPASEYVKRAHEKGLQVWAVWTDVDTEVDVNSMMASSTKRRALIEKMITNTKENGIDGINIDFEKISAEGADSFIQFLRELSIETHANNIILSVDNYALASVTGFYDRKEQGNVADYVVIMGYDEHWASSAEAGSVASLGYVERGIKETIAQVPASKVINAVPFYTRIWRTNDEGKVGSETIGMQLQNDWIAQVGITPSWDNEACQNYGEATVGGKLCQIWMEDAESLEVKLNVMDSYELAGVAEWKLGFETPDIWDVFENYMKSTPGEAAETETSGTN